MIYVILQANSAEVWLNPAYIVSISRVTPGRGTIIEVTKNKTTTIYVVEQTVEEILHSIETGDDFQTA